MQNIAIITDADFGIKEKPNGADPIIRYGARGIVIDENDKIAVIFKKNKNEYKLPGGGIDGEESPAGAFRRECAEELGCEVAITGSVGTIEEYKSQENFKQISYVFVAKKAGDRLGGVEFTEKEGEEGAEFLWLSGDEAIGRMKKSLTELKASKYDSVYRTQFMVARDIKILEYFLGA